MNIRAGSRSAWLTALGGCAVLVSITDAILLEISQTFFTAGFNGVYIEGAGSLLGFAASSLIVDLSLVVGVWAILLSWVRKRRWTPLQKLVALTIVSIAVPFSIDFVQYQVGLVLGRAVSFPILLEVAGGGFGLMLAEAAQQGGPLLFMLLLAAGVSAGVLWLVGKLRIGRDLVVPQPRPFWLGFGGLTVSASLVLVATADVSPNIHAGLTNKPSSSLIIRMIQFATDVDRDGSGLLSHPSDPAPFDASRHPFAIDVPGNGIDENGLGGDLPPGWVAPTPVAHHPIADTDTRRPDFLLVYLESFRADRIGATRNGKQITPFLNQLAREGASSERAYVHSPYTIWSRAQLYGGVIDPSRGQRTLIDDFKSLGYTVAHFSGQDDSFGRTVELLGLDRADHFYDARQDVERRTSRSTNAGGLQISSKLLGDRVEAYLAKRSDPRPLFLYVNFVDTHFPYTHGELDDLLEVPLLTRYEISASNAEAVRATYDNTTANVDLAIRRLVEDFRKAIGNRDHAILIASDHGQALFERGFLGHGQSLTDDQTRTPLILWGVGGDWPEPLGIADVRGLLQRNLFTPRGSETPRARLVPDPERQIFHFMAQIHRPHIIGLRTLGGLTSFNFDREALESYDASGALHEQSAEQRRLRLDDLIRTWEATRATQSRGTADKRAPGPA